MELDPEWYAYQCKSGEVLFYYNADTGEHRWAIHFCSCIKSKMANSITEPCCVWEPVKSQTSESGKFVRSIGTETEDQYFSSIQSSFEQREDIISSPRTEITFEYSVCNDKLNDENPTESSSCTDSSDKPVEVFLEDPFIQASDEQNISSQRLTLKLKDISTREEFSLDGSVLPKKVTKRVDDLTFPRRSLAVGGIAPVVSITSAGNNQQETSSQEKHPVVRQRKVMNFDSSAKKQPLYIPSSLKESLPHVDNMTSNGETFLDSLQAKRFRGTASSRKNPEPRKLLKRTNLSISEFGDEEKNDEDREIDQEMMNYEDDIKANFFDSMEEHSFGEDTLVVVGEPSSSAAALGTQEGDDTDDQTNLICELCGKECATPTMLTNHLMKHQPTGTTCPICNKYFSRRQGLRYHVQTHSGDKPHVCKICNKTFTKSASLVAHNRTHSGIRPFKCPKCNKGFTHSSNLSSHLRIHSSLRPYQCKFCSKGFKTSSHLALHIRSHSDERPYECSKCGKAFKNSSHLRSHEKLHLLPKTVFCDSCGEGFRSFSHLIYHQQTNPHCSEENDQERLQTMEGRTSQDSGDDVKLHLRKQRAQQYARKEVEHERSYTKMHRMSQNNTNDMEKKQEQVPEQSHLGKQDQPQHTNIDTEKQISQHCTATDGEYGPEYEQSTSRGWEIEPPSSITNTSSCI